jgi:hypothetical protein
MPSVGGRRDERVVATASSMVHLDLDHLLDETVISEQHVAWNISQIHEGNRSHFMHGFVGFAYDNFLG